MAQPDPQLGNLLKWSIENSTPAANPGDPAATELRSHAPASAALATLFGAPSDAAQMRAALDAVQTPTLDLGDRLTAFDNFEQLIESIDNANNLAPLGLWAPLLALLAAPEPELRRMAAWCVGTAVQNNPAAQQTALDQGAVGRLVRLVRDDAAVRRKAAYAISSEVRNFQPAADALLRALGRAAPLDAGDMEAVDRVIGDLREGKLA